MGGEIDLGIPAGVGVNSAEKLFRKRRGIIPPFSSASVFFKKVHRNFLFSSSHLLLGLISLSAILVSIMKTTRKCLSCKVLFVADYRNNHRQEYCTRDSCQRARRHQEQRLRRAAAKSERQLKQNLEASRRLQTASQTSEAVMAAQSPVIIGLISILTDSLSREDIEKTIGRLWQRGNAILCQTNSTTCKKRPNTA